MDFKVIETKIKDLKVFQPEKFEDTRGYLIESYRENFYEKYVPNVNFVQDNESQSSFGVIRGLHYQVAPFEQSKLIRVIKGKIQDIAVDLRKDSPTYLDYVSVILSNKNRKQLYIPRGFAHGFLVLSDEAIVNYKMDEYFNQECYRGLRYDDPKIDIKWELDQSQISMSDKDRKFRFL